jgi:N-methylhydantoinase A/oxoprolinase/acetone carboxylase beta subunit
MRIGIDVGGTNTDAVLMGGTRVVAAVKTVITADVTSGIVEALPSLVRGAWLERMSVDAVMIGTISLHERGRRGQAPDEVPDLVTLLDRD